MLTLAVVLGVALLAFLGVTVGPLYVSDRFRETRHPSDQERSKLSHLREGAGLAVERVAIVQTSGEESVDVAVRGPPGRRVLFVTDYVLTGLDEEVTIGLLAAEAGRVETYYTEFRGVAVGVVLGILATIVATLVPFDAGFLALLAVGFASFWVGRRVQYAADARAAEHVGADLVADAFQHVADLRGVEPETGTWRTYLEVQPPLGDRIARLRRRAG